MENCNSLEKLPYWKMLSENEKGFVKQNVRCFFFKKGTFLQKSSEACMGMLYVLQGSIRVVMISEQGREITLFRLKREDYCVLSASCVLSQITFETHMIAEEDTQILVVNSGAYEKLMNSNIYVKCFTYELAMERFSTVVWVLQQIIFARLDQRLACFLIDFYERSGEKEIRMTQDLIAKNVNSAREAVARMLKQFTLDDLIEMKRGSIIIKNLDGLKKLL